MSWQCRLVEYKAGEMEPGDMWYGSEQFVDNFPNELSDHYHRDWKGKRLPLWVMTPGGAWCVDKKPYYNGQLQPGGWAITGEAPNVTASPSINFPGRYHGWLRDGVLTDDVEGRSYES